MQLPYVSLAPLLQYVVMKAVRCGVSLDCIGMSSMSSGDNEVLMACTDGDNFKRRC